jgi:hypothetical protein
LSRLLISGDSRIGLQWLVWLAVQVEGPHGTAAAMMRCCVEVIDLTERSSARLLISVQVLDERFERPVNIIRESRPNRMSRLVADLNFSDILRFQAKPVTVLVSLAAKHC